MNERTSESDTPRTYAPGTRRGRPRKVKEPIPYVDGIPVETIQEIPLGEIDMDNTEFEFRVDHKIKDLVEDLEANGQQFPVILRRQDAGKYQVVSGFRRCRSIRALEWSTVKAIVRDDLDDDMAFRVSFLENDKRKSLTGKDKANAMAKLRILGKTDAEIQDIFGIGKRQVQRYKKLTTFPDLLLQGLKDGALQTTHALELMRAREAHGKKVDMALWVDRVFRQNLSVRTLVRELNSQFGKSTVRKRYLEKGKDGGFRLYSMMFDPKKTDATTRRTMAKRLREALQLLDESEENG